MSIQQHPLPQDISNYRFRLIGDMTIKQFASLGISIVLAIVVYSLPLPFFFKYPLSFVFVVLGVGMAFVPVQGRSLDVWIVAFIKSIYSPTQYSWKRTAAETDNTNSQSATNASKTNISTPPVSSARIELIQPETVASATPAIPPASPVKEDLPPTIEAPAPTSSVIAPVPTGMSGSLVPESKQSPPQETITPPEPIQVTPLPAPEKEVITPQTEANKIASTPVPQAEAGSQLPIPFTPSTPNTLVGLTITPDSRILDGVMVEIKKNGLTIRATKSNKLGQFMFARPLENGIFQILAEKDGFQFSPYSLELTGAIVRPLKIQAA